MVRRTKEQLKATDAIVKRQYKCGQKTTEQQVGKINRSLANAGLPQIEDWDSWKKSFLKRGRKVKKNLKKGRKQRHGKEATDFIKSVGGAAVALAVALGLGVRSAWTYVTVPRKKVKVSYANGV